MCDECWRSDGGRGQLEAEKSAKDCSLALMAAVLLFQSEQIANRLPSHGKSCGSIVQYDKRRPHDTVIVA